MEIHWISIVLVSATIHPLRELLLNKASNPVACYLGVAVVWLVLATFQNIIVGNDFRIPRRLLAFNFYFCFRIDVILLRNTRRHEGRADVNLLSYSQILSNRDRYF